MYIKVHTVTNAAFDNGYASLRFAAPVRVLDTLAAKLRTCTRYLLAIDGFTANDQTHDYNLDLSLRRADAVRDYLLKRGIPASAMRTTGRGEEEPLCDNGTAVGRDGNRRVEVRVTADDGNQVCSAPSN